MNLPTIPFFISMEREMIEVSFLSQTIQMARIEDRPWVFIDVLCEHLGIDTRRQVLRMRRHHDRAGLELRAVRDQGKVRLAVPLEEINWFLRTLRPTLPDTIACLRRYRGGLFWSLLHAWIRAVGQYMSSWQYMQRMVKLAPRQSPGYAKRQKGIDCSMAEEMKQMRADGHPLAEISLRFGYSPTTISLVVHDKYPCLSL